MSDAYEEVIRGGLKLKDGSKLSSVLGGKIKKKKKKKDKEESISSSSSSPSTSRSKSTSSPAPVIAVTKTAAQMAFEEAQKKRERERIAKVASKSHKERVAEFNQYLESLSEHHDLPKVGPG
ncbi:hypothetical protein H9P43_008206 [Blastocladiella emersonii ATCC 22665]|nr:hypothetical protein H9P43_008206 [Blastocladiella emersonii ATCC 22665]